MMTIPALWLAFALILACAPVLVPLALARDLIVRGRLAWTRFMLATLWYLYCECWGMLALVGIWLARPAIGEAGLVRATSALQRRWAMALTGAILRLYAMRIEVAGGDVVRTGPLILLVRHASVIDTLLPIWAVSGPNGLAPRYVVKQELRVSPCLDVAGHRVPTVFVHRGEGAGEVERVAALAEDLGSHDLVVLYPEGTRFSRRRLAQRLAELRERDDALLELAAEFRRCLPPRSGGVLGLIERAPGVDVAVLTHVGFEGVRSFGDLVNGALIGRTIDVQLWRIPAAQIPAEAEARRRWVYAQWLEVDRWVAERLDRPTATRPQPIEQAKSM